MILALQPFLIDRAIAFKTNSRNKYFKAVYLPFQVADVERPGLKGEPSLPQQL